MTAPVVVVKRATFRTPSSAEHDVAEVRAKRLLSDSSTDVLRYLARRTRHPEDAADLLAETMLVVWKKRLSTPTIEVEARMWFFGIARRLLLGYYRGRSRSEELADSLRQQIALSSETADPDGPVASQQRAVRTLLAALPVRDREIVTLVHWEGLTLAEIALVLGISSSTVRSRYRRARTKLRQQLEADET